MRVVLQRVSRAEVRSGGRLLGEIAGGLLLLIGFGPEDGQRPMEEPLCALARKICKMRIFADHDGKFNLSLLDVGGAVLAVSQFTLYADTSRGNRPGFSAALAPDSARALYQNFILALRDAGAARVEQGEFGADMQVSLCNDGPVTITLEG